MVGKALGAFFVVVASGAVAVFVRWPEVAVGVASLVVLVAAIWAAAAAWGLR